MAAQHLGSMAGSDFVVISCATGSEPEAIELAKGLVEQGLAACVQCAPVRSVYRWEGAVTEESETLLLIKTQRRLYERVEAYLLRKHAYENPEIIACPVEEGSGTYLEWIAASTAQE